MNTFFRVLAIWLVILPTLVLLSFSASAQTIFSFTGALQTYTVPVGAVGVIISASGAGGGGAGCPTGSLTIAILMTGVIFSASQQMAHCSLPLPAM
jgi:hypothetical protein